jgi:rRNA processing protein Krr1/Pno1
MTDIVERLRTWFKDVNAVSAIDLMDEAANEIDGLRKAIRRLVDQDATLSVQGGSVIVTMDATLTDEEREAVEASMHGENDATVIATLRKLLARLGGER